MWMKCEYVEPANLKSECRSNDCKVCAKRKVIDGEITSAMGNLDKGEEELIDNEISISDSDNFHNS